MEEALCESASMRRFVGIDLGREPVPDETTTLKFRHLPGHHELGAGVFEQAGAHLQAQGFRLATGTIVDAALIAAPSSTKNAGQWRDPEMHQSKRTIERIFNFTKVRYRGLAKNGNRMLFVAAALSNLYMVQRQLPAFPRP